jgi:hypothetical protein
LVFLYLELVVLIFSCFHFNTWIFLDNSSKLNEFFCIWTYVKLPTYCYVYFEKSFNLVGFICYFSPRNFVLLGPWKGIFSIVCFQSRWRSCKTKLIMEMWATLYLHTKMNRRNNVKTIEGYHLVEGIIGEKKIINSFIIWIYWATLIEVWKCRLLDHL